MSAAINTSSNKPSSRTLLYRLVELAVAGSGHRKVFRLGSRELGDFLERYKKKRKNDPPGYIGRKHNLAQERIAGWPCSIITPKEENGGHGQRAALFIHGGGYMFEAHWVHWRAASRLVSRLGIPVWFPAYPLFPDHAVPEAAAMLFAVYAKMLEQYPAAGITVLGDSAGANLALSLCHHINRRETSTPMPGMLVLVSPVMITEQDETILDAMRRIGPRDVLLSMELMRSMIELFKLDRGRDNYYYSPLFGDFSRFPPLHVFSGTFEFPYPQIAAFVERLRAGGIPVEFHPGQEMMHVWPYMPLARECREALDLIFRIIQL